MTALATSTTKLAPAFVGEGYETSFAFSTADAAVTASAATTQTNKDALPASLSYSGARITGTPVPADEGTYNLAIKFTGAGSDTAQDNVAFTLRIYGSRFTRQLQEDTSLTSEIAQLDMGDAS